MMGDPPAPVVRYVRATVLLGVLVLGVVTYVTQDARQPAMTAMIEVMRIVVIALGGAAFAAVRLIRRRISATTDYAQATRLAVVAWTIADLPAVFGAVVFFITGDAGAYFVGVLFLLLAGFVIPSDLASEHAIRPQSSDPPTIRHDA